MAKAQTLMIDGEEVLPIVTSHSIDGTFRSCQRKFEFAHVYGQVPAMGESGYAAEVGTSLHEAVQAWASIWLSPGAEQTPELYEQAMDAGYFALLEWFPYVREMFVIAEKKVAAKQRGFDQALMLYEAIVASDFWADYELAVLPDGSPAIEIPYRIVHRSAGIVEDPFGIKRVIVTQGKIDFVLRHKETGVILVYDLKTTVKPPADLFAAYRFSGQAIGYSLALSAALSHDFRQGFRVVYLTANFLDLSLRPLDYFVSAQEVQDYLLTRDDLIKQMVLNLQRQWWPRSQHGCESFMESCPYLDICHRRDAGFIGAWLSDDDNRFVTRDRIYEAKWTFMA